MKNLPEKIYLNLGDLTEEEYKELDFHDLSEVTWSEDDVQGRNVEYVRKDAFVKKACDAYCKVCGHYPHTVPTHICRHDCHYFSDFVIYIRGE